MEVYETKSIITGAAVQLGYLFKLCAMLLFQVAALVWVTRDCIVYITTLSTHILWWKHLT